MPHPHPSVPLLGGLPQGGEAKLVVEEPFEAILRGDAVFEGPQILVHGPRHEWHAKVHIQDQDEEAQQRIISLDQLSAALATRWW